VQKLQVFKNKVPRKILEQKRGEERKFVVCARKSREKNCVRGREVTPQMKQGKKATEYGGKRVMERRKRNLQKKRKIIKETYNKEVNTKLILKLETELIQDSQCT
jgi:hypothetical protein